MGFFRFFGIFAFLFVIFWFFAKVTTMLFRLAFAIASFALVAVISVTPLGMVFD